MKTRNYHFNLVELSTPILMMLWAVWFFLFEPLSASATFSYLAFLPRLFWAALFASVSLAKAYSIVYESYRLRRGAAAVSVLMWTTLAVSFAFGNFQSHLVPTCAFFAYQSFLSWHRIEKS